MAKLSPTPLLGRYDQTFGDLRLRELTDAALVSLAIPLGHEKAAMAAIKTAFNLLLPDPGHSTASKTHRLIRTGPDQGMLNFTHASPDAEQIVKSALKGKLYTTDQTDAWVFLSLEGRKARAVLERICPLDLHDAEFPVDSAARTVMEHMGVIIVREGAERYVLMSASSSAGTFLHAVETSIRNVL